MDEHQLPSSWEGSVILDIGGSIGALMLRTSSVMDGSEIDLIPENKDSPTTHSAVRQRQSESGISYAAVYPTLAEGTYTVAGTNQRVVIEGGKVTDVEYESNES